MGKYLDLHDVASGNPVAMAEYNEMLSEIAELRSEVERKDAVIRELVDAATDAYHDLDKRIGSGKPGTCYLCDAVRKAIGALSDYPESYVDARNLC